MQPLAQELRSYYFNFFFLFSSPKPKQNQRQNPSRAPTGELQPGGRGEYRGRVPTWLCTELCCRRDVSCVQIVLLSGKGEIPHACRLYGRALLLCQIHGEIHAGSGITDFRLLTGGMSYRGAVPLHKRALTPAARAAGAVC